MAKISEIFDSFVDFQAVTAWDTKTALVNDGKFQVMIAGQPLPASANAELAPLILAFLDKKRSVVADRLVAKGYTDDKKGKQNGA